MPNEANHTSSKLTLLYFLDLPDHYQNIAVGYDSHYEGLHRAILPVILDKFNFAPDDRLLDLGSGTGTLAQLIREEANLKSAVICVDPNEAMVAVAKKNNGITVIQATAEEFVSRTIAAYSFNKVLIAFSSHHFAESRVVVLRKLSEHLPPGGVCLIVERQKSTTLPFFKSALEEHRRAHANDLSSEQYCTLLQPLWFEVSSGDVILEYHVTKSLWYETLRERYISFLHQFTDEQIEDGIRELEMQYHGQKHHEDISVRDPVVVHKLVKTILATQRV